MISNTVVVLAAIAYVADIVMTAAVVYIAVRVWRDTHPPQQRY